MTFKVFKVSTRNLFPSTEYVYVNSNDKDVALNLGKNRLGEEPHNIYYAVLCVNSENSARQ